MRDEFGTDEWWRGFLVGMGMGLAVGLLGVGTPRAAEPQSVLKWGPGGQTCDAAPINTGAPHGGTMVAVFWRAVGGAWQELEVLPADNPELCCDEQGNPIIPPRLTYSPHEHGLMPPGTLLEYTVRARNAGGESCDANIVLWLWPDLCEGTTAAEFQACCIERGGCWPVGCEGLVGEALADCQLAPALRVRRR